MRRAIRGGESIAYLLQKFCDSTLPRITNWDFSEPFNVGAYTYTSNGFVVLRVRRIPGFIDTNYPVERALNWDKIELVPEYQWLDVKPEWKGYQHPRICIAGPIFTMEFIHLIADLPQPQIAPQAIGSNLQDLPLKDKNRGIYAVPIRFTGGDGFIMPCKDNGGLETIYLDMISLAE